MSTPTPRTDAAWSSAFNAEDFSASSVARSMQVFSQKIEIELAAANEVCRVASEDALLMRDDLYKQLAAATTERDHWQKIAVSASREREHNANVAQAMTAERDLLRACLRDLVDEQNGAPLELRRTQWQAAMDEALSALTKTEDAT